MIKKEFNEVIKQTIALCLMWGFLMILLQVLKILPAGSSFMETFFPLYQAGILFFAYFLGISMFSSETRQRGIEYILTLPYSRMNLLGIKLLPRFITVVILYLFYLVFYFSGSENSALIPVYLFSLLYFSVYIIAISFSAFKENFVVNTILVFITSALYLVVIYYIFYLSLVIREFKFKFRLTSLHEMVKSPIIIVLAACFLLGAFISAFLLSFKKFDIRPGAIYSKRFYKYLFPLLIIGILLSFFTVYSGIKNPFPWAVNYIVTKNHKFIKTGLEYSRIYDQETVTKIKSPPYYFRTDFLHSENSIYFLNEHKNKGVTIDRLDLNSNMVETISEINRKILGNFKLYKHKNTLAYFEWQKYDKDSPRYSMVRSLILLDLETKMKKVVKLDTRLKGQWYGIFGLFGVSGDGEAREWLLYRRDGYNANFKVLAVTENGRIRTLTESDRFPLYVNNQLITFSKTDMLFAHITPDEFTVTEKIKFDGRIRLKPGWWRINHLNYDEVKYLYGEIREGTPKHRRLKLIAFDLENKSTIELMSEKPLNGWFVSFSPSDTYYLKMGTNHKSYIGLYILKEGQINLIKKLDHLKYNFPEYGIDFNQYGMIVKQGNKIEVFTLPDLKKLEFKKL